MGRNEGNGRPHVDAVDGRGSPVSTDPRPYLAAVVRTYTDASRSKQLNSFSGAESPRGYFEGFRRSRFFRQHVFDAAADEAERTEGPLKLLTVEEYGHKYAGFLFEQMAYADNVVKYMGTSKVVLSPEQVHDMYKIMYPDKPVIQGHFGQHTIEGISQPDGLVIDKKTLEIEQVLEYKLFNGQENFEKQIDGYEIQRKRTQRRLFGNSRITMVTPKDFSIETYHNDRNVGFDKLSVTRREFGSFVQNTYYQPVINGEKALVDMIRARDAVGPKDATPVTLTPGVAVSFPVL